MPYLHALLILYELQRLTSCAMVSLSSARFWRMRRADSLLVTRLRSRLGTFETSTADMQGMSTRDSSCGPWRQSITSTKLPAGVRPPPQAAVHLRGHLLAGAIFPCDDDGLCAALAPALPLLWLSLLGGLPLLLLLLRHRKGGGIALRVLVT